MSKLNNLLTELGNHSISAIPLEACGIITKELVYIPCKNVSFNPTTNFIIDPLQVLKYEDNIWGFFHSHPNIPDPIPSINDMPEIIFKHIKFIVGFANKFYIYWNDNGTLKFEKLDETYNKI